MSLHEHWVSSSILEDYHPHKDQHEKYKYITSRITRSIRNRRQPPPIPVIGIEIHRMQFLSLILILFLPFAAPRYEAEFVFQRQVIHKDAQKSPQRPVLHFYIRAPPEEPLEVFIWNQQGRSTAVIGFSLRSQLFVHVRVGRKIADPNTKNPPGSLTGFNEAKEDNYFFLIPSSSIVRITSSPTTAPPVSSALCQVSPKSLRLILPVAVKPTRSLPHGSLAAPRY